MGDGGAEARLLLGPAFLPARLILSALITGLNAEQRELLVLLSGLNLYRQLHN